MGKSTINGAFSIAMLVYQRVPEDTGGISRNTRGHQGIPTVPGDTRGLFPSLVHGFAGQKLAQLIIQGSGRKKCNGKCLASP